MDIIKQVLLFLAALFSKKIERKVMPSFGRTSSSRLSTAHPLLQELFREIVKDFDCSILCGHRTEAEQTAVFNADPQLSKVQFPNSEHNSVPSMAVDVAPYPINWNNIKRFYFFGGFVVASAKVMGIDIRWGGDWDSDTEVTDQKFMDLPHFELTSTIRRIKPIDPAQQKAYEDAKRDKETLKHLLLSMQEDINETLINIK